MGKDRKFIFCGGLAFTEEMDMKKLSYLAKEGWILDSFKYSSYQLKKSEPEDVIYCVDHNDDKNDLDSYFEIFKDSDWEHICSSDSFHFFKAKTGTAPIYTDSDTLNLKYKRIYNASKKGVAYSGVIALIAGLIYIMIGTATSSFYWNLRFIASTVCGGSIGLTFSLLVCNAFIKKKIVSNRL